jgi:hypothetical protein
MNLHVTSPKYSKMLKEHGWNIKTNVIRVNNNLCEFNEKLWSRSTTYPAPDIGELLDNISNLNNIKWINEKNRADALAKIWCEQQEEIEIEKKIEAVKSIEFTFKLDKLNRKNTKKFLLIVAQDSIFWNILIGKDLKDAIKREIYKNNIDYIFGYDMMELLELNHDYFTFDDDKAVISEDGVIKLIDHLLQSSMDDYYENNSYHMVLDITDIKHVELVYPTKDDYYE